MSSRWFAAVAVVLGGCGGIVVDGPPVAPAFVDDAGGDAAPGGASLCLRVESPPWCPAGVPVGYRCEGGARPADPVCVNIGNLPGREPRWCC